MGRLRAAICDDDPACIDTVETMLRKLAQKEDATIECLRFPDGADLLDRYPEGLDMLFLDIEMLFLSGMEAARQVRARDSRMLIVFISSYAQYVIQGYEVDAWRYLLKPLCFDHFARELRQPLTDCLWRQSDFLCVKGSGSVFAVPCDELLYIGPDRRKPNEIKTLRGFLGINGF